MISKPCGTNGVGSSAKVAVVESWASSSVVERVLGDGGNLGGDDSGAGNAMGGGIEVGGGGVVGGGSAGNGGSVGVAGEIGLGIDPRVETEAPGEYISADRSGETELVHGTHL